MAVLNSKFDIKRGWPNGSAVAEDFTKDPTSPLSQSFRHGTWVRLGNSQAGAVGSDMTASGNKAGTFADSTFGLKGFGMVIEGNEDFSSKMSNTVTCLVGGGFVVTLHQEDAANQGWQTEVTGGESQYNYTGTLPVGVAPLQNDASTCIAGNFVKIVKGIIEPEQHDVGGNGSVPTAATVGVVLADNHATNKTIDVLIY